MYSTLASTIFAYRNYDKAANGDVGRGAVAAAQAAGVIQEVAKYDGLVANGARSATSVFSHLAQQNKAFEYAGKVTKFAVNNVNPLICVSAGIKTAMSDDKVKTGITEATALTAMFAGEGLTKLNYGKIINSKAFKNLLEKASKQKFLEPVFKFITKHKLQGKIGTVVKAITFIAASMGSYAIGHKYGEELSNRVKANLNIKTPKKIDQKA